MSGTIQDQIRATGLAQVIVVLKGAELSASTTRGGIIALGLERTGPVSLDQVASGLEQYFSRASDTRDGAIAIAARGIRTRGLTPAPLASASALSLEAGVGGGAVAAPGPRYFENLGIMLGSVDANGLDALNASEGVTQVVLAPEFSLIRPVATAKSALAAGPTWGLMALKVPELHAKGLTGKGVLVGHLDTGVDASHPALKAAVTNYVEFDLMGRPVPNALPRDSGQHGTHTAGTIAGRLFKTTEFGVAPEASLASAMVIEGGNVIARVLAGLDWAVGLKVRVISMSLGLRGYDASFLAVTQIIRARNILPVFAVGNEGPGTSRSPGNYDEALSVGASDSSSVVADFSSSMRFMDPIERFVPDLVAPGVDVMSSIPGGKTELFSGSSMATPHIAGLAALLFQAFPTASADQVEAAIFASAKRPVGMTAARGGRGIPDGVKALKALATALGGTPALMEASAATPAKASPKSQPKPKTKTPKKAKKVKSS